MYQDFTTIHSIGKNQPSVGDVHVTTAMGNSGKGKKRRVITTVGPTATLTAPKDVTAWVSEFGKHDMPAIAAYQIHGLPIAVETPAGTRRTVADERGIHHDVVFDRADYGRIPHSLGADGDELDVYAGPDHESDRVWVINQAAASGAFDEVKIMAGFAKKAEAKAAYMQSHFGAAGEVHLAEMIETSYDELLKWIAEGETRGPYPGGRLVKKWRAPAPMKKKAMPEGEDGRKLVPFARGLAKNPLPVHRHALSEIRADQTPRLFEAMTKPDRLDKRKIKMGDLTAIQDRVDPQKVAAMMSGEHDMDKRPVVARFGGRNYVVDGDHHIAALWLKGKEKVKVRYIDLSPRSEAIKRGKPVCFGREFSEHPEPAAWSIPFEVTKVDKDQQLVFGWASISTEDGKLVVDRQDDMIEPAELEKAAYDFVLYAREHGHMHEKIGVGKMIESMVFTLEKQNALGIRVLNDKGQQIEGWWTGFRVDSKSVWAEYRDGKLPEFSIGGSGVPVEA